MSFPIRTCVICSEEFELRPDKPGYANRCPTCSEPEEDTSTAGDTESPYDSRSESEVNAERRRVIRDMLYRKED